MYERRNLFVGAAEDLRNPTRVIRVSCRKPHKGRLYLFSVFARHTYADQKAHGRRHFIRQLTEMIHHAFDVTNIFKHDGKRGFFNSTDRFFGAGKNDFLFGGEVIVDAAALPPYRGPLSWQRSATFRQSSQGRRLQAPISFRLSFLPAKHNSLISVHYPVFLIIRYQTSQNKSGNCLNNNYKFLGSHCLIKHHNNLTWRLCLR